ncbi:hypothetical protein [Paenibacillus sabinae]|uniref:Uncharacterized protein n=1 Tax=Paenibacillus sabinae T27 TaxID=1268072 RepID=X4ZP25_9BACL|nr:hypothetical protein [Paenibacillus sabinae]AHV98922.1 hypothetical protein PSAB_20155 [Paenibacillus sabinae T27]
MAAVLPEKRMSLDRCAYYGARQPGIPGEELFERLLPFERIAAFVKSYSSSAQSGRWSAYPSKPAA